MIDLIKSFLSAIPQETEFWSAIIGAVVGGIIAFAIQMVTLRASKKQRDEDRLRVQQALGHSLLFKMVRIYSNTFGIHRHIEECFENARNKNFSGEPWNFILPLANLPDPVHFSADEMGMLLAQKDDDLFNAIASMDVVHNSLIDLTKLMNANRKELTDKLRVHQVEGTVLTGYLRPDEMLALQPRIIEFNSLIEQLRPKAKVDCKESGELLDRLIILLRAKLGLTYKLERLKSVDSR